MAKYKSAKQKAAVATGKGKRGSKRPMASKRAGSKRGKGRMTSGGGR